MDILNEDQDLKQILSLSEDELKEIFSQYSMEELVELLDELNGVRE